MILSKLLGEIGEIPAFFRLENETGCSRIKTLHTILFGHSMESNLEAKYFRKRTIALQFFQAPNTGTGHRNYPLKNFPFFVLKILNAFLLRNSSKKHNIFIRETRHAMVIPWLIFHSVPFLSILFPKSKKGLRIKGLINLDRLLLKRPYFPLLSPVPLLQ